MEAKEILLNALNEAKHTGNISQLDVDNLLIKLTDNTFKAGERKVVEWVTQHLIYIAIDYDGTLHLHLQTGSKWSAQKWQEFLKSEGIE